jgi:predicted DNA-binding protein (UPF0278 family)
VPHKLHFKNYSREELFEIFKLQIKDKYRYGEAFLNRAEEFFAGLDDEFLSSSDFGNGRFVRNVVERVRIKAMLRQIGADSTPDGEITLTVTDLESAVSDSDIAGLNKKTGLKRIGFQ